MVSLRLHLGSSSLTTLLSAGWSSMRWPPETKSATASALQIAERARPAAPKTAHPLLLAVAAALGPPVQLLQDLLPRLQFTHALTLPWVSS